jgi:DNA-binding LacI/PurR family transcriptional regulator
VLNDLPNVRPATRQRVEKAIAQLRYVPSPAARAMVTKRSRTVGLVVAGLPAYGPATIALHFEAAAREARYSVSMVSQIDADPASLRASCEFLLRQNVEAVVVVSTRRDGVRFLSGLELGVPLVVVSSHSEPGLDSVALDQYAGARVAVEHLVSLGHRQIRHVAGPADSADAAERERGWRDVLAEHDLVVRDPVVGDWTAESGYAAGRHLLADRASAVFVANDVMALGVLRAFGEAGVAVPAEVSVVGFDDVPEAAFYSPPLTTVHQDFFGLGRSAFESVLAMLDGDGFTPPALRLPVVVPRSSTATAAR